MLRVLTVDVRCHLDPIQRDTADTIQNINRDFFSLPASLAGYSRYPHRKHTGYHYLLLHPHLKAPKYGHGESDGRYVHQEVEHSDEKIERLLIPTEAIDGLIPKKSKRPAYQEASQNYGDTVSYIETLSHITGCTKRGCPEYPGIETQDRAPDESHRCNPEELSHQQRFISRGHVGFRSINGRIYIVMHCEKS